MDRKIPFEVVVMGAVQAVICLLMGGASLYFSLTWILADVVGIATGAVGNLTGMGIILGPVIAGFGSFYLFGLYSSLLLLKLNRRGKKFFTIFLVVSSPFLLGRGIWLFPLQLLGGEMAAALPMTLIALNILSIAYLNFTQAKELFVTDQGIDRKEKIYFSVFVMLILAAALFSAMQANQAWQNKLAKERQHQAEIQESYRLEDEKILQEFDTHKTVTVVFDLTYADAHAARRRAQQSDTETRKALNRQFAKENIFDPIGPTDMPNFKIHDNTIQYKVEVTKAGYEKLRANKYARWITLKKK